MQATLDCASNLYYHSKPETTAIHLPDIVGTCFFILLSRRARLTLQGLVYSVLCCKGQRCVVAEERLGGDNGGQCEAPPTVSPPSLQAQMDSQRLA